MSHKLTTMSTESILVRRARPEDARSLRRLAALDSRPAPRGEALLAEAGGEIVAALPLDRGPVLADPFRPTADLVEMLQIRAGRLAA